MSDGDEVAAGTDQNEPDSDGEEADSDESTGGTDPLSADSDGDGLDDGTEGTLGTDPTNADSMVTPFQMAMKSARVDPLTQRPCGGYELFNHDDCCDVGGRNFHVPQRCTPEKVLEDHPHGTEHRHGGFRI